MKTSTPSRNADMKMSDLNDDSPAQFGQSQAPNQGLAAVPLPFAVSHVFTLPEGSPNIRPEDKQYVIVTKEVADRALAALAKRQMTIQHRRLLPIIQSQMTPMRPKGRRRPPASSSIPRIPADTGDMFKKTKAESPVVKTGRRKFKAPPTDDELSEETPAL
eukprot:gnl/Dysnectes_brevis/2372_a2802_1617.p1 GENE.gnl/Dysnectes_brevis/2372_a2802_1617~~gnl/Dysnectes_brevis/2372_a2802_1617.p1  ORF type:complete len:181 (-),score=6.33 gnl/Dysnectes_brevis/2372_a2802_1617:141-623(-)